jgi:hypothetical protein
VTPAALKSETDDFSLSSPLLGTFYPAQRGCSRGF